MPARADRPGGAPRPRPGTTKVRPPMPPQRGRRPERISPGLRIVHEDAEILVLDKPPGMLTSNLPGESRDSVFDFVKQHVRRRRRGARAWIIHRLDKEASGLLVFAKSEKAFEWLKEDFRSKRVHRLYIAVVEGEMRQAEAGAVTSEPEPEDADAVAGAGIGTGVRGTIQSFVVETRTGRVKSIPADQFRGTERAGSDKFAAKLAVTHYRVLGVGKGRSLLQVRLQTGRKHQIRAHLSESGHPILGDAMYDAGTDPVGRLALHAADLGITHPTTGQTVRFHSPAPAGFYRAVGLKPPVKVETAPPADVRPSTHRLPVSAGDTSWDHVADWYDGHLEGGRSDHFERVILPGALRLLRPRAGMKVLDVACGQGSLCRLLAEQGVDATGVDASPRLVEAAQRHASAGPARGRSARFVVGDARELASIAKGLAVERGGFGPFDAATCVMALMNIDPLEPVFRGCASLLAPGGVLVAVILHPAFRAPGQSSWGWEEPENARAGRATSAREPDRSRQYRRVDGYLSPGQAEIVMNPGHAAHGKRQVSTWTFHRPIQSYFRALAESGFLVESLEEWPSLRRSEPGPRSVEENRARREIPMFLGLRAVRRENT